MEGRYFDHADERAWSVRRLKIRLRDVLDTSNIPHGPERMAQIDHEIACLAFELLAREQESERAERGE